MPATPPVLLADADVLIDYRESELAILNLVVQHVGRVEHLFGLYEKMIVPLEAGMRGKPKRRRH